MPDIGRDVDDAPGRAAQREPADLSAGARTRPWIVEDELHLARDHEVAVLMLAMQVPALHVAGPDREHVGVGEGVRVPAPPRIEHLGDASALVDMGRGRADHDAFRQGADGLALRRDRLRVADGRCQRLGEEVGRGAGRGHLHRGSCRLDDRILTLALIAPLRTESPSASCPVRTGRAPAGGRASRAFGPPVEPSGP